MTPLTIALAAAGVFIGYEIFIKKPTPPAPMYRPPAPPPKYTGPTGTFAHGVSGLAATTGLYVSTDNLFEDPLFGCFSTPAGPYIVSSDAAAYGVRNLTFDYLSTIPNTAVDRIAAIENKVASDTTLLNETISKLARDSVQFQKDLAARCSTHLRDSAEAPRLLAFAGLTMADRDREQAIIEGSAEHWLDSIVFRKVIIASAGNFAQNARLANFRRPVTDLRTADTILTLGKNIAMVVPFVGPAISLAIGAFTSFLDAGAAGADARCAAALSRRQTAYTDILRSGLPLPLGLVPEHRNSGDPCGPDDTTRIDLEATELAAVLASYQLLPDEALTLLSRWWSLCLMLMAHPHMQATFQALQGPQNWDMDPKLVASDEDVYLIALPLALAYGMDLSGYPRVLWSQAGGWKDQPRWYRTGSFGYHNLVQHLVTKGAGGGSTTDVPYTYYGGDSPIDGPADATVCAGVPLMNVQRYNPVTGDPGSYIWGGTALFGVQAVNLAAIAKSAFSNIDALSAARAAALAHPAGGDGSHFTAGGSGLASHGF